jgi:hypothetical protein
LPLILDGLVVAGVLLAVLLAGSLVLRPFLVSLAAQLPVVGPALSSRLDSVLNGWQAALAPAANSGLGLLSELLTWLDTQGRTASASLFTLSHSARGALLRIESLSIPHAIDLLRQELNGLIREAVVHAGELVAGLEVRSEALLHQSIDSINHLIGLEVSRAREAELALEHTALAAVQAEAVSAGKLFQEAERTAVQVGQRAEAVAHQLVAGERLLARTAEEGLKVELGRVESELGTRLGEAVSTLGGDLAAAEARAGEALSGLEASTVKSIEGILDSLPWSVLAAGIAGGEAMLKAEVRTLVGLGAKAVRDEIGNAAAIRAKYGPGVRAALAELRAR